MFKSSESLSHVYGWPDLVVFGARRLDTETHSYPAIAVGIALDGAFKIELQGRQHEVTGMIVEAKQPHQYDARAIDSFIALYSFAHPDYARLSAYVHAQGYRCLDGTRFARFRREFASILDGTASCGDVRRLARRVASKIEPEDPTGDPLDGRIKAAILRLHSCLGPLPALSELARGAELSSERFRHLFKQQTGMSFRYYLRWVKANRAVWLAAARNSVTEVAVDAGFSDAAHMSRTILQTFGLSPSFFAAKQRVQMHTDLHVDEDE